MSNISYTVPPEAKDETGKRYGKFTVLKQVERDPNRTLRRGRYYLCQCDCGRKSVVSGYMLRSGKARSCWWCEDALDQ